MGSRNSTTIPVRLNTAPSRLTVGAAAVQGPNVSVHGVVVKTICPGQVIYLGTSNGVTTATGFPLYDGESMSFEVSNLNQLWFIASAAAQAVAFLPYVFN
jgi:hypothetical protein